MVPNYIADDEDEIEGETPEERALRLAQAGTPDFAGDQNDAPVASRGQAPPDVAMDQSEGPPAPSLSWTKSVNPANGKTVVVPSAQDKAISGYEQALGDYPEKKAPIWLQRIAAGAAGGLAGWSNAAGRARPIDTGKLTESIEHPGYESKLEAWRSRVAPAQMQVELEGQRAAAQQKSAETSADIAYKQAHANYMNGVGRAGPSVEVSPEMEEATGGVFKAGMKIPASTATEIARISAGKYEKPERTVKVSSPEMSEVLGMPVGADVPYSIYKEGITARFRKESPENEWGLYLKAAGGDPTKALAAYKTDKITMARESRPPGTTVNLTSLSPDALDSQATAYHTTGQLPQMGFGKAGAELKTRIMNRAAELFPKDDLAGNRQDYAASGGAIKDLEKSAARVRTSEGTAARNLDLAQTVSDRVDRTGSPIVNKYLLFLKGQVVGDDDTQLLNNAVETAANEYAGVVTAGSGGGVAATDSAREHARSMLHSSMANGTFKKVVSQMKTEMGNRQASFQDSLKQARSGRGVNPPPSGPSGITVKDPRGVVHTFPNQAAADNFKKLANIQ